MTEQSRIRFNPVTKEIEIEGTEKFVKTYFDKLQAILSGLVKPKGKGAEKSGSRVQKSTHMGAVVGLIQESAAGIATSALKEKTGLTELQIWNIVNRAAKAGKIRKIKRGLYGTA